MTIYLEAIAAIQKQDLAQLAQIIRQKSTFVSQNYLSRDLDLPLEVAVGASGTSGISGSLKLLVEAGFNINEEINHEASYRRGSRLTWTVIRSCNIDVLEFLMNNNLILDWAMRKPDDTPPPLAAACYLWRRNPKHAEMIRFLIQAGAQVNPEGSVAPLHQLVAAGRDAEGNAPLEAARILLDNGALPNRLAPLMTANGNFGIAGTALHAYWNSGTKMVELLLDNGASPEVVASNGLSVHESFERYQAILLNGDTSKPEFEEITSIRRLLRERAKLGDVRMSTEQAASVSERPPQDSDLAWKLVVVGVLVFMIVFFGVSTRG